MGLIGQRPTAYLKSLGSRLCRAKGKRDLPPCLPAVIWPVAVDTVLFLRLDGALCEAVASIIDTDLFRCIRSVPPDGYWREGISGRAGYCEVNTSLSDDGGG